MRFFSFTSIKLYFVSILLGATLFSCDDDDEPIIIDDPDSLVEELAEDPDFTLLTAAVDKAGLTDTLSSEDTSFTILSPPDEAFIAAGITDLNDYTPEELAAILQYHVLPGEVSFSELELGDIETLNGTVNLSQFGNQLYLNGEAEFIQINFGATNGLIHVIDDVLLPPTDNITDIIGGEDDLSTLEAALNRAGLASTLADAGPYTVFAPTDLAFEVLLAELEVESLDDIPTEQLAEILQYHVLGSQMFSTELEAGSVNTILDEDFTVAFTNAIILVDDNNTNENAVVIADNALGTNGIVHKIDRVLLPN